jgi:hypothetical protein
MAAATPDLARTDPATASVESEIRTLVRGMRKDDHPPAELSSELLILKLEAASIAEIDKLMDELQTARNYLHAEGERVRRMAARYAHLTQTAMASVKIISERMREWRVSEPVIAADAGQEQDASAHDGAQGQQPADAAAG